MNIMINEQEILNASILIVDDQHANVLLLEQILRGANYQNISSTMDPYSVCALHQKNRYDLILLDLQMPGMDGFQVMEGLKKIETDGYLPVLVITAQPGHKLRALAAGAKEFTKIFGPVFEMLGIQIDDVLGKTRDNQRSNWDQPEREILDANLAARRPFLDFIYSRTNPDGSRQYLMVSGEPIFDPSGRFSGYRGIGKDVTETMSAQL
jgi:CheY-like chemotaxis protein